MEQLPTVWEYSPGDGLHGIGKGNIGEVNRKIRNFEVYTHDHYMTMTFRHVPGTPTEIAEISQPLNAILGGLKPKADTLYPLPADDLTVTEIDELKQRAYYDYIDPKNTRYRDLWDGKWEDYYSSPSEADLAFSGMLLIKTNGNMEAAKELFLESQLMRKKTLSHRGDSTYLDETLLKAQEGYLRWKKQKH